MTKSFIHIIYPSGSIERPSADCQTEGCGIGANCVAEGKLYVCRCLNGLRGDPNERCSAGRINCLNLFPLE